MPERTTLRKAQALKREGKAPTTTAGPFVEEEIRHIREGKHGARGVKQAIAIGLSKARRSGVAIPKRRGGKRPSTSRRIHQYKSDPRRARSEERALERMPRGAGSRRALSRQGR